MFNTGFDPYDALQQLATNQGDIYNRLIIMNRAIETLKQYNEIVKAELNIAHHNNEVLENQIQNLHYEIAILKCQKTAISNG